MTRRLLLTHISLTLLTLLLLEVPFAVMYSRTLWTRFEVDAREHVEMAALLAEPQLEYGASFAFEELVAAPARAEGAQVVIVDRRAIVVQTSDPTVAVGADLSNRPELAAALKGEKPVGSRHSPALGEEVLYASAPVIGGDTVYGAARVAFTTERVQASVYRAWAALLALGCVVLVLSGLLALAVARWAVRPIRHLDRSAARLATSERGTRVDIDRGPPEVRSLASTFNSLSARLDGLLASQEAFVADASHQLRSPLTALRLRVENLEAGLEPAARTDLEDALKEVDRLTGIVDGLLALARAEQSTLQRVEVDVAALARSYVDKWSPIAAQAGARLDSFAPEHEIVRVVPGAVEQVLDNLISNAIKASPPGGHVHLQVVAGDQWTQVHVIDEGPGLTAEQRRRAFDRFWRAQDRPDGGSGLGLAIVRRLVTVSGGQVELAPGPHARGLDVTVHLPRLDRAGQAGSVSAETSTSRVDRAEPLDLVRLDEA